MEIKIRVAISLIAYLLFMDICHGQLGSRCGENYVNADVYTIRGGRKVPLQGVILSIKGHYNDYQGGKQTSTDADGTICLLKSDRMRQGEITFRSTVLGQFVLENDNLDLPIPNYKLKEYPFKEEKIVRPIIAATIRELENAVSSTKKRIDKAQIAKKVKTDELKELKDSINILLSYKRENVVLNGRITDMQKREIILLEEQSIYINLLDTLSKERDYYLSAIIYQGRYSYPTLSTLDISLMKEVKRQHKGVVVKKNLSEWTHIQLNFALNDDKKYPPGNDDYKIFITLTQKMKNSVYPREFNELSWIYAKRIDVKIPEDLVPQLKINALESNQHKYSVLFDVYFAFNKFQDLFPPKLIGNCILDVENEEIFKCNCSTTN